MAHDQRLKAAPRVLAFYARSVAGVRFRISPSVLITGGLPDLARRVRVCSTFADSSLTYGVENPADLAAVRVLTIMLAEEW